MKYKKTVLLISLTVLLLAIAVVGVSVANFTDTKTVSGKIAMGNVDISLQESHGAVSVLVPGERVSESITVSDSDEPSWVRVKVDIIWLAADGSPLPPDGISGFIPDPNLIVLDIKPESAAYPWFYDAGTGYYYYRNILEKGQSTVSLCDSFTLAGAIDNRYQGLKIELDVKAEAIQADNMTIAEWISIS